MPGALNAFAGRSAAAAVRPVTDAEDLGKHRGGSLMRLRACTLALVHELLLCPFGRLRKSRHRRRRPPFPPAARGPPTRSRQHSAACGDTARVIRTASICRWPSPPPAPRSSRPQELAVLALVPVHDRPFVHSGVRAKLEGQRSADVAGQPGEQLGRRRQPGQQRLEDGRALGFGHHQPDGRRRRLHRQGRDPGGDRLLDARRHHRVDRRGRGLHAQRQAGPERELRLHQGAPRPPRPATITRSASPPWGGTCSATT